MNRPVARFLPLLLLFAAIACDEEATGPQGTPSTVSVRAFVDVNGSGSFDAGDALVTGAQIFLVSSTGGDSLSATTNATGIAQFTDVEPGSYTVRFGGTIPPGAVLTSATRPVVVAPFAGGTVESAFVFVFNPGGISGVLFRDNNGNNVFDANIDTPAPGLTVRAFAGTDTTKAPVATTTTGAAGQFTFTGLRPGSYTLLFGTLPTMTLVGGAMQTVTVQAQQTATASVRFTGSLILTTAAARSLPIGSRVAIEGVATVGAGAATPFGARTFYVQDAAGGIMVFFSPAASAVPVAQGDSVRVAGTINVFSGELEVDTAAVQLLKAAAAVPAARVVTAVQLNARTFEGQLVRVPNAEIVTVPTGTGTTFTVIARDQAGTIFEVRIANALTAITRAAFVVGPRYNITGILGSFNGTAQLKPRTVADVQLQTLNTIKSLPAFTRVTVEGVATVAAGTTSPFGARTFYVQDAASGIMVFFSPTGSASPVALGDSVRITGVVNFFSGEAEVDSAVVTLLRAGAAVPTPRVVTGVELNARTFEGQLLRVNNVEVVTIPTGTGTTFTVIVRDPAGAQFEVRIANALTGITRANFGTVGSRFDLIGVLGSFNGTAQLKPRTTADIIAR